MDLMEKSMFGKVTVCGPEENVIVQQFSHFYSFDRVFRSKTNELIC